MPTAETQTCPRCGENHGIIACGHVKAIQFDETGHIVVRVEFLTPLDYPSRTVDPPEDEPAYPRYSQTQERTNGPKT